jgi:molybdopterin biosynthesis enzyme
MVAHSEKLQRIARLTPLGDVLPLIDALARPVAVQSVEVRSAHRLTLADDVRAVSARPAAALALRDGWAVASADILDASAGAPVPLTPPPQWLESATPIPQGADAIVACDAVTWQGGIAEAVAPVAPGEGVLASGADVAAGAILRRSGKRVRSSDVAVLKAAGIEKVSVRVPRIAIVLGGPAGVLLDAAIGFLADIVAESGGVPAFGLMDQAFHDPKVDAVIVVGGTGTGRRDGSVRAVARSGRVAVHGVAISPGETAALGEVDGRPVLLIPGRLDCIIAVWLLLGRPLLARLSGSLAGEDARDGVLARKVASSLGLAEVIPVRRGDNGVEPLASGYLSLAALADADGWIMVPAESEGYPAGARVTVRPLP